jgi:hypothetical protein
MDEDILKAIEQVAVQAESDQERRNVEAYINHTTQRIMDAARSYISVISYLPEPTQSHLDGWQIANRNRIAQQFGEVVRILLRKELLGE